MPSAIGLALESQVFAISLAFHILTGALGILLYWATITRVKGSPRHKALGRVFFVVMFVVGLSVGPILFTRPGPFDPAFVVQFMYQMLCLFTILTVGWTAIRWKGDLERFRGRHFKVLGVAVVGYALVVLAVGIGTRDLLTAAFSLIGLVFGVPMVRFAWLRARPQPKWWLAWHLNAICILFDAVHANFLAVMYEHLVDPGVGDAAVLTTFLGTGAIAIALRYALGRRFGAPMRFAAAEPALVAA